MKVCRMEIPSEAIKYILYQRTAYQLFWNQKIFKMFHKRIPRKIYHWFVALEAVLRRKKVMRDYTLDILGEYKTIEKHLPEKCRNILDIGCGVAGIDVCIYNHYPQKPNVYLLDKTKLDDSIYYSFNNKAAFYNSLEIAGKVLAENGVDPDHVTLIEVDEKNAIDVSSKIDFIISLISWGYHYPVSVYIDQVSKIIAADGVVILDIRRDSTGIAELQEYFSTVKEIHRTSKFTRVYCQHVIRR